MGGDILWDAPTDAEQAALGSKVGGCDKLGFNTHRCHGYAATQITRLHKHNKRHQPSSAQDVECRAPDTMFRSPTTTLSSVTPWDSGRRQKGSAMYAENWSYSIFAHSHSFTQEIILVPNPQPFQLQFIVQTFREMGSLHDSFGGAMSRYHTCNCLHPSFSSASLQLFLFYTLLRVQ